MQPTYNEKWEEFGLQSQFTTYRTCTSHFLNELWNSVVITPNLYSNKLALALQASISSLAIMEIAH